jgi:hypothetical protein
MDDCPRQDQLRDLLDERLERLALAVIVIHVETCPRYQDFLVTLTARQAWKSTVRDVSEEDQEGEPDEASSVAVEVEYQSTCHVKKRRDRRACFRA